MHVSETCYIESFTEVKEFLHSIRKVGATNSNEGSYCQSPSLFRAMLRIYERDFTGNEGIMATYHALFIHITKEGRDEMKQVQTKGIGKTCIRRSGREDDYKRRCNSDIRS